MAFTQRIQFGDLEVETSTDDPYSPDIAHDCTARGIEAFTATYRLTNALAVDETEA